MSDPRTDQSGEALVRFVQNLYDNKGRIGLHEPLFIGQEKRYLSDAIDSTFVSTSGKHVEEFEDEVKKFTGAKHAIATVNGTAALHLGLKSVGVSEGSEVVTQAFTFVATANSISYTGANPVFVDIDTETESQRVFRCIVSVTRVILRRFHNCATAIIFL